MPSRLAAAFVPLVVAACATTPPPVLTHGPAPDAAHAGLVAQRDGSLIAPYTHRVPVEPGNWRKLNDRQAPAGRRS